MKVTTSGKTVLSPMLLIALVSVLMLSLAGTAQSALTTIASLNDGELDQHINWHLDPKGIPGTWTDAQQMFVGRLADDYGSPDVGPSKFGAMTFDVSSLAGRTVTGTTLRLIQTAEDGTVDGGQQRPPAVLPATMDVYGVNSGVFDEATSSWNNYVSNSDGTSLNAAKDTYLASGALSQLGTMTNVNNPGGLATGTGGVTTFSDVDLTALVQTWIDNPSTNLGLMLLHPAAFDAAAPAGPNDVLARYATHESTAFDGPQLIIEHIPEPTSAVLLCGGLSMLLAVRRRFFT